MESNHSFINDFSSFTNEVFARCRKDSEESTKHINLTINELINDARRVASVSEETISAFDKIKLILDNIKQDGDRKTANEQAALLKKLAKEDKSLNEFAIPILETLQFQDRISQVMEHMQKIVEAWLVNREQFIGKDHLDDQELQKFGNDVMGLCAMTDERDIVRKHISGLPEEEADDDITLFF